MTDRKGKEMAKELIAYFSATGTTKRAAERLAKSDTELASWAKTF